MNGARRVPASLPVAGFAACLFAIVLGAKWSLFDRYGSPMPDWDQWDAEAGALLIPWFEGRDFLREFFHPHNEHRVILTKVQALALTLWNGQWDSRVLAVFNAILHSAIAAALWLLLRRGVARRWQPALFVLTVALFALPFAWQNILGGFHSQQYWLVGLSIAAVVAFPFARPGSPGWWAAALATAAALLTMASGLLAPAVVLVVVVFRASRRQTGWRDILPTAVVALGLVAIGLLTQAHMPGHEGLKAQSVRDFIASTIHSMEWPLRHHEWAAFIMWLPWTLLLWRLGRHDDAPGDQRSGQTIAALGGWTMLQILATSYARGVGADYPASRYMDTLAIGALANGAALGWLASRPAAGRGRLGLGLLAAAWAGLLAIGLYRETDDAFVHHLPGARRYYNQAESHLRGYLATNDRAHFAFPDIPYPSADGLIDRLDNPHLRALMPAIVRAPLPLKPAAPQTGNASAAFIENAAMTLRTTPHPNPGLSPKTVALEYVKTWGSYGPDGAAATGEWRSAPISSPLGAWLKFETAGQTGQPGVTLELRDAASDALLAAIRPSKVPGDNWRAAYVRAPAGKFVVVARDTSPSQWMAFGAPVELGTLSYHAWRACKHGWLLLGAAATATVLLSAITWWLQRREPAAVANRTAATPASVA